MITLAFCTHNPTAELYLYNGTTLLEKYSWTAHRELSVTIHQKIDRLLHNNQMQLSSLQGIIFYEGPGSFTGLRIGVAVANALASALGIPIVASGGEDWLKTGLGAIKDQKNFSAVAPIYGSEAVITQPKK